MEVSGGNGGKLKLWLQSPPPCTPFKKRKIYIKGEICLKIDSAVQFRMTYKTHSISLIKILFRQLKGYIFFKLLFLVSFLTNNIISRNSRSGQTYVKKTGCRIKPWFQSSCCWHEGCSLLITPLFINLMAIQSCTWL